MKFLKINACDGVYDSLDVRFTKTCDNDCDFCIERDGLPNQGMATAEELADSTTSTGIDSVLILGGEPMLYPERAKAYTTKIRKNGVKTIYLTTSLPPTIDRKAEVVDDVIDQLTGLNVSIQSIDWEENNKILKASNLHNRIEMLRKLNLKWADKIRTSINLVRGGVDSKEKLLATIKGLEEIGCKYIKINELQNSPDYVSYEEIMGITMPSPFAHGCSTEITIPGVTVKLLLKRSCFLAEKSRKASIMDLLKSAILLVAKYLGKGSKNRFAVMYENGRVERNWLKDKSK